HLNACYFASCEGHSCDAGIFDDPGSLGTGYKDGSQDALGQPGFLKDALDLQSNPRDVGGMFENGSVACHQCRSGKAEDLPVGKVPGHDRQNDTQRTEGDVALSGVGDNFFISKEAFGIVSKKVAVPGAFFDFGLGLCDRFAHFKDSSARQCSLVVPQM